MKNRDTSSLNSDSKKANLAVIETGGKSALEVSQMKAEIGEIGQPLKKKIKVPRETEKNLFKHLYKTQRRFSYWALD